MTTPVAALGPLPRIARLGFDDGWLILGPTFFNFGVPSILIDYQLVGPTDLGLEPFGTRDPAAPWAPATACWRRSSGTLGLWTDDPATLVIERWFDFGTHAIDGYDQMILLVGDTRAVELSWSALWTCSIGTVRACTTAGTPQSMSWDAPFGD